MLKFGRYDFAAWATFVAYAAISLVIPIVIVEMGRALGFPLDSGGMAAGGGLHMLRSVAMIVAMVLCGFLAKRLGIRRSLTAAVGLMALGIVLCAVAPAYLLVLPAILIAGFGEGIVEGLATPFVQNIHDREPGRYVNFAHGFWSLGTLLTTLFFGWLLMIGVNWRFVIASAFLLTLPALLLLAFRAKSNPYPETKRQTKNVGGAAGAILREPRFWIYFFAIFLGGGGEFCLTFWCASFIRLTLFEGAAAMKGALGAAVFSLGMFAGRTGFGMFVPQKYLKRLLLITGVFGVISCFLLPLIATLFFRGIVGTETAFALLLGALFFCGLASAPYWPSIQSLAVERLPHLDSTMMFVLLSCAGVPGCGIFAWGMGALGDRFGLGLSFLLIPAAYLIMTLAIAITPSAAKPRTELAKNE